MPVRLNRSSPIEAARRSLGARAPRCLARADTAKPTGGESESSANRPHAIRHSIRGWRGEPPLVAGPCASVEAPAALFGLEPTSTDELHSATEFAPPAPPDASPAGTNYQPCKTFFIFGADNS